MIASVMPTYAPADLAFERGEGAHLFATDGRRYLDFASGIGVNALGHGHPHLVETLTAQGSKLWHCSNLYRIPNQETLARRLVDATFADTVFMCNSGTEAVECGIKMVRAHHHAAGNPGRFRVITANNAFHGRTMAGISAGGQPKHVEGFAPLLDGFDHVPFGNLNELRDAITEETGAILVEAIQGEGGIVVGSDEYLRGLRAAADEFGLLLFFDEVQCGMGRSGKLFAYEWAGVTPDIVSVAKGIGGGFPLGACLATERAASGMTAGTHGSTFGGNPLASAIGGATLDVMLADGFLDHVVAMGELLRARCTGLIETHPSVFSEIRGRGLMIGLVCRLPNREMVQHLRDAGLLTVAGGADVVRLLPPLIIDESHVDEAMAILDATCAAVAGRGQ